MRNLKILIIILVAGYVVASLLLYVFQERFIFLGEPLEPDHEFSFDSPFEEVNIKMEGGGWINALHFRVKNPKGLIVYYHGNAGNLAGWGFVASNFTSLGYEVAIMDYRGYGKSYGKRTQETMLSDALAFYNHFKSSHSENEMILYGRSLGTGLAAYVASKTDPRMLILETPYYSFTSLVQSHVPVFPASPSLKFKFKTHRYLKSVNSPVYIFHGTDDSVVPFRQGQKLFNSLEEGRAQLFVIEDGGHNNLDSFKDYWVNLESILQ